MDKKILYITIAAIFFPILLYSQAKQGLYLKVDYLMVEHDQLDRFKNGVIPELQEHKEVRLSSGDINSWTIYRVLYSGSDSRTYNYVSVTSAESLDSFDEPNNRHNDQLLSYAELNRYTLPRSELWSVRNSIRQDQITSPSNFLMMDYMNVRLGRELEYQMLEDEVAKPLHEKRIERDIMEGWEMYQLVAPGGIGYGYNFATGNYFNELRHIEFGFNEELIRSQNPNVNLMEFFEHIWSTRDLVRSELWQKLTYVSYREDS